MITLSQFNKKIKCKGTFAKANSNTQSSNLSYRYIRSSYEGRTADALALGTDERRDKLR